MYKHFTVCDFTLLKIDFAQIGTTALNTAPLSWLLFCVGQYLRQFPKEVRTNWIGNCRKYAEACPCRITICQWSIIHWWPGGHIRPPTAPQPAPQPGLETNAGDSPRCSSGQPWGDTHTSLLSMSQSVQAVDVHNISTTCYMEILI